MSGAFSTEKKDILKWSTFVAMFIGLVVLHLLSVGTVNAALVGYWNFDDPTTARTAQATVGGVDGSVVGGAQFTGTGGIQGGAIQITNGYIDMGNHFASTPTFSVQAWVRIPPGNTSGMMPVAKHWGGIPQGWFLAINDIGDGYTQTNAEGFYSASGPYHTAVGGPAVNDGSWHQLVGVYNNGATSIYVDGNLAGTGSAGYSNNSAHLMIGGCWDLGGRPVDVFNGLIDEVKIWDNALTQADITQLYRSAVATAHAYSIWDLRGTSAIPGASSSRLK
jgi:hypothetical protein